MSDKNKKRLYWSYAEIPSKKEVVIEQTLRFGSIDEIRKVIEKYGLEECRKIWIETIIPDKRMIRLNHFLARFIFNIPGSNADINRFIKDNSKTRLEKIIELSDKRN